MSKFSVWSRRLQLHLLSRSDPDKLLASGERQLLKVFRRAAETIPLYRNMLNKNGATIRQINKLSDFKNLCELTNKEKVFDEHHLKDIIDSSSTQNLSTVLTSSGHGGKFAFGVSSRAENSHSESLISLGLSYHFNVDRYSTLLINCLAMGIQISAKNVTVADIGPREDMAIALTEFFSDEYDQVIYAGEPLFLKRFADQALASSINWSKKRVHIIIGGETFGESFRDYLSNCFAIDPMVVNSGSIKSSFGVAELGLNIMFETDETVELRRRANTNPGFCVKLFGADYSGHVPMIFAYSPLRTYFEILDENSSNVGKLAVSLLGKSSIPLFRYLTGDLVRNIDRDLIRETRLRGGQFVDEHLKFPMIAFFGREADQIGEDATVLDFKDALYTDPYIAREISGAIRVNRDRDNFSVDIQLAENRNLSSAGAKKLSGQMPGHLKNEQIRIWAYDKFPYGGTLDYQRKFNYLGKSAVSTEEM